MSIEDKRVREVALYRWMPYWWVNDLSMQHPKGTWYGWNPRSIPIVGGKADLSKRYENEFIPVFVDMNGEVVRLGCSSLLDPQTGQEIGSFLCDDKGRYLVLSDNTSVSKPNLPPEQGFPPDAPFDSFRYLSIFLESMKLPDGQPVIQTIVQPQAGSMIRCLGTSAIKTIEIPVGQAKLVVDFYVKQLGLDNLYSTILGPIEAPPLPDNTSATSQPQRTARATIQGLVNFNNRLVRLVSFQNGAFVDDSQGAQHGQNIDPTMVEFGYIADAATGAFLMDRRGFFFRVNPMNGQVVPLAPQKIKPHYVEEDDSWVGTFALFALGASVAYYFMKTKK